MNIIKIPSDGKAVLKHVIKRMKHQTVILMDAPAMLLRPNHDQFLIPSFLLVRLKKTPLSPLIYYNSF